MTKEKISLAQAQRLADEIVQFLKPYCERIEIGGSIRREKAEVGDIEIVCIPKLIEQHDLFDNVTKVTRPIDGVMSNSLFTQFRVNGALFKSFMYKGMQVDLFLTTPEQWGYIFALRTGPREFNMKMVKQKRYGGYLPAYITLKDGEVRIGGKAIPVYTEHEFFELLGIEYLEPKDRK